MLHKIDDSPLRDALLKLVEVQRMLVEKLCALPKDSPVTLDWLKTDVWPAPIDPDWIEKFWKNDKGRRKAWIEDVAKADVPEKQEILRLMEEQLDYANLYVSPPRRSLTQTDKAFWTSTPAREAIKNLMVSFYSPWLGANQGYPAAMLGAVGTVTRLEYLKDARPILCPYCDTKLQSTEVDHFLPKSAFPFLSVHPDNFVPSCHDSNEASEHKGDDPPLDWDAPNQADNYFHPRLRPARSAGIDHFSLSFRDTTKRLRLTLMATDPAETVRVENLDSMFKLSVFWGNGLETHVQDVQEEVVGHFQAENLIPDDVAIRDYLRQQAITKKKRIGTWALALYDAALYEFVANDDELVSGTVLRFAMT
ncbi:hypothetical protein [Planctomycetes bacterium TBK1r]|uniref:HNH nuclease domain-containing protein n=1 Tax=Stieleria magnilauensis TaxID=2527963 RepID=A0ABX5XTP4_9BACT|nr:hypothetical protein TBK1r_43680 [Planctomycetes bacterium TBK1r]